MMKTIALVAVVGGLAVAAVCWLLAAIDELEDLTAEDDPLWDWV